MPGRYTREGDVRELLRAADDCSSSRGPATRSRCRSTPTALPPLPAGWTRTFLLHSDGYSKEMDINSASPDQAWPLPFRTMTRYPYAAPERYPGHAGASRLHRALQHARRRPSAPAARWPSSPRR